MMSFQSVDSTKESFLKYAYSGIKGKDTPGPMPTLLDPPHRSRNDERTAAGRRPQGPGERHARRQVHLAAGRAFMSGVQALVRLPMLQRQRDAGSPA
jgi:hypothetical protein